MSRDRYPSGGTARDREAWARRQIALAFGMRPHEAILYLQGVVREAFGQGKRAGIALALPETGTPPPVAPEGKCPTLPAPATKPEGKCPGVTEYGHGFNRTVVHDGRCCDSTPPTPAEGRGEEAIRVGSPAHVALWDAINAYAAACAGRTEGAGSVDRMLAVARIETALRSLPHGDGGRKGAEESAP